MLDFERDLTANALRLKINFNDFETGFICKV